jgi:hypothetical protein
MGKKRFQRTTITIPPDLKERMDAVKEEVNWSALAARAFEEKLIEIASRKAEQSVNDVIRRLRASKCRSEDERFKEGEKAGREWAKTKAEYEELDNVGDWDWDSFIGDGGPHVPFRVYYTMHPERSKEPEPAEAFWTGVLGERFLLFTSDAKFMKGFMKGVAEVWRAVEGKV